MKKKRISFDQYAMRICHTVALRSTCRHRDQGAIIVKDRRVISTGYNGAPPGVKDCLEMGYCSKDDGLPCLAEGLHGESNAIASAARAGISVKGATMYCVYSPCRACANMIAVAGIDKVFYEHIYDKFPEGPLCLYSLGIECEVINA